jgi:SNF2 family DNA or RNA helicase
LLRKKVKFYIINYDAIIKPKILRALLSKGFGGIIFDESIKIKNYKSKRTQAAYALARATDLAQDKAWGTVWREGKVVLLSGRPVSQGIDDLFGQFYVLDGGKTFGKNYFRFRNKYFRKLRVPFPKFYLREGALASIRFAVEKTSRIYKKQECLDLPPRISKRYSVILSKEQSADIDTLRSSGDLDKGEGCEVVVDSILPLLQKEQQITGGFIYGTRRSSPFQGSSRAPHDSGAPLHKESTTWCYKENPKLNVLQEILTEELDSRPTIIVYRYRGDFDCISGLCHKLGLDFCEISGRTKTHEEVNRFVNTDVPICLCQISAGSLGIDGLQTKASDMIFYSLTYRMDEHDQMQHRIDRHGQKSPCTYYYLVAKDSIDEDIMSAIKKKVNISDFLMRRRTNAS